MFHIDATFEDTRIIATSLEGHDYTVLIADNLSGQTGELKLTSKQLSMIFAINLDIDGTPAGYEEFYKQLEPLFEGTPKELRPIP
jgi:hypothetical protein